jgi:hypothetical protein
MGDEGKAVGWLLADGFAYLSTRSSSLVEFKRVWPLIIRADVLFTLGRQHKPRVSHNEQLALSFRIIEGLGKPKAFLGV